MSVLQNIAVIKSGETQSLQIKFSTSDRKEWSVSWFLVNRETPYAVAADLRKLADRIDIKAIKTSRQ